MQNESDPDYCRTQFASPRTPPPPANANRLAVLVVLRGAQVGRRYLLNENSLVIGRRADRADLVIHNDPLVSSVHCRIERGPLPDSWSMTDLSSTNGTMISGVRIAATSLRDGDRIQVGDTLLKFCFHDEVEEEFHRQVDHLMNLDDLTGLPVQRVYQQRLYEALRQSARRQRPLAVYMMDMDGLKKINDQHGHLLGAHSIATTGRRLGQIVGEAGGVVSRFGGDEFSAFVGGADKEQGLLLGQRMRAAVADGPFTLGGVTVAATMSIGVAFFPDDGTVAEALTRRADEALYRAKAAGRNCVSV